METNNFDKRKYGTIECPGCIKEHMKKTHYTFMWADVDIMPVGYKGMYRFYVRCPRCDHLIVIPEDMVPLNRRIMLKMKLLI